MTGRNSTNVRASRPRAIVTRKKDLRLRRVVTTIRSRARQLKKILYSEDELE